jgi:hypothetical protein
VQALLSLQLAPAATAQLPVAAEQGLQVPQADPEASQAPLALQTCGCDPPHCLAPGSHEPAQVPLLALQTNRQAEPVFFHAPLASQT